MSVPGTTVEERIRHLIGEFAGLSVDLGQLRDDDDLYAAGMTSHASVNVMLALESEFDLEFPDRFLRRSVFENVASIKAAIDELNTPARFERRRR